MALILSVKGHEVKLALDGLGGLDAARAFRPELAFIDIGMPGMNGFDVAQALRREMTAQCPVLVTLTGWGSQADIARACEAGFHHHVTKPVSEEIIENIIKSASRQGRGSG